MVKHKNTDFLDFDSIYDTIYKDYVERSNEWADFNLKQSFGDGKGSPEEGIQSASILDVPGKVKFEVGIGSDDHVNKQTLVSAENTSNYSTGHTVDVNFDRDSMNWLPQNILFDGISKENEVQICSQTRPYDFASGIPTSNPRSYVNVDIKANADVLACNNVSPTHSTHRYDVVENFQVSSVQDFTLYDKYMKLHKNEADLSDHELVWTKFSEDHVDFQTDLKQSKIKNIHKCTNYSLYNADWCNIPCNIDNITSLHTYIKAKKLYFNADHSNEPNCTCK